MAIGGRLAISVSCSSGALTAGAAASVAAIPAIAAASEPDPVLALIEAYKAAWVRLIELDDDCSFEAENAAGAVVDAALDAIMRTPPSTPAGMRAVLQHLVELDNDGSGWEIGGKYLPTLLRSPFLAA